MTPEKAQELTKDMKKWGNKQKTAMTIDIKPQGIEKALTAGKAEHDAKEFDREVVIFSYLINSMLVWSNCPTIDKPKRPIERLFEALNTRTYRIAFKNAKKKYATDEIPTDFMRDLYRRFLQWRDDPNREPYFPRSRGMVKSLDYRWELKEYPRERWMDLQTYDHEEEQ